MFPFERSLALEPKLEAIASGHPMNVVLVSQSPEEVSALEAIFRSARWSLRAVRSMGQALVRARNLPTPVILVEADAPDGRWEVLLESMADLPCPPRLIVFSRLADERLWAEVLNLGGFDVVSTPFESQEISHCVGHAMQSWQREWDVARRGVNGRAAARPIERLS